MLKSKLEFTWTFSCSRIPLVRKPSTFKYNLSGKGKIKPFSTLGLKFRSYWDINSRSMLLYENHLAHRYGRSNTKCKREGKAGKGFSPSPPNLSVHATARYIRTVSPSHSFWQLVLFMCLSQHSSQSAAKKPASSFLFLSYRKGSVKLQNLAGGSKCRCLYCGFFYHGIA